MERYKKKQRTKLTALLVIMAMLVSLIPSLFIMAQADETEYHPVTIYFKSSVGSLDVAEPIIWTPSVTDVTYDAPDITGYIVVGNSHFNYFGEFEHTFYYSDIIMGGGDEEEKATVTIHYQDEEGNTIKDDDVHEIDLNVLFEDYADSITGYWRPGENGNGETGDDYYSVTATTDGETFEHTFIYKAFAQSPEPDNSYKVTVHYQDEDGNTIRDTDVFNKTGERLYINEFRISIDGYNILSDSYTNENILYDGEEFEFTFVYSYAGMIVPEQTGTVDIYYVDTDWNEIQTYDRYEDITGTQVYYAPYIEGYTVSGDASFTITITQEEYSFTKMFFYTADEPATPTGTIYIYYRNASTYEDVRLPEIIYDVTGTQTYYAPEVTGFNKPSEDSITFTVVSGISGYTHVFLYNEEVTETPIEEPPATFKATVTIKYVDDKGNPVKDSDVYTEVTGTQNYVAGDIEGFSKPEVDTTTFTVTTDGESFEYTFVYTPMDTEAPKGNIYLYYRNADTGEDIKLPEIVYDVVGTQTYYAPEISGFIKPSEDSVTFTVAAGISDYTHIFLYEEIIEEEPSTPPVEQPTTPPKETTPPVEPPTTPPEETTPPVESVVEPDEHDDNTPVVEPDEENETVVEPDEETIVEPVVEQEEKPVVETVEETVPAVVEPVMTEAKPVEKQTEELAAEPVAPRASIVIMYQDEDGNKVKDSNVCFDIEGTITFTADDIEGYNKPAVDRVTFTITEDGQFLEHTFVYSKKVVSVDEPIMTIVDKPIPPKEPTRGGLPIIPIVSVIAIAGFLLPFLIKRREKFIKTYLVGDDGELFLSKKKVKVNSDEVSIDISEEYAELGHGNLKIVFSKGLSKKLLHKKIKFTYGSGFIYKTIDELTNSIEIAKEDFTYIVK